MSGIELLEVVNKVFAYLDQSLALKDIRDEDTSVLAARMLEFIVMIKYKTAAEMYVSLDRRVNSSTMPSD
jgi:hypothetical protein